MNWTSVVAKLTTLVSAPFKTFCMPWMLPNNGCNKKMIRTAVSSIQDILHALDACESFVFAAIIWKHPRHAKCLEWSWQLCESFFYCSHCFGSIQGMQNVLNGADTNVVNLATTEVQFITSSIGLMIYGLHLHASGKSFITLLVIKYSWRFWPWKCKYLLFLLDMTPRDCWETCIWWGDPSTICSLASAPDQGSIAVQLHLSYITQALHAEEVNEQRKEVHAVDILKASNIIRAYKESCLPSQGRCLFRLLICLLLHTNFNKIINYVQTFIL